MKKIKLFLCIVLWAILIAPAMAIITLITWDEDFLFLSENILFIIENHYEDN